MPPSRNKFVLILLLALLQCFAPLLHAHTHGSPAASGVHLDGVEGLAVADSGTPAFTNNRGDADRAIAMAQEYRQDRSIALSDADQPVLPGTALPLATVLFRMSLLAASMGTSFPGGPLVHSLPFPQAPPHLI